MKHNPINYSILAMSLCLFHASSLSAPAQSSAFTYQGILTDNLGPANGLYDLRFELWDASIGGTSLGVITNNAIQINDSRFSLKLDFGLEVFDGTDRWLGISARANGTPSFTTLSPRQQVTPTPYALHSASATNATSAETALSTPWTGLTGVPPSLSDGQDDDTTYTAGAGLSLNGSELGLDLDYADQRYLRSSEGVRKPARVYSAVIGINEGGSAPVGFEATTITDIIGTGGPVELSIALTADNLLMGAFNSATFGGPHSLARLNTTHPIKSVATRSYTGYGRAHVVMMVFNTDDPALAPPGYTYVAADDVRGNSGWIYILTGPGGFYLGGLTTLGQAGADTGPGMLQRWFNTEVKGIAFRVFSVEEDTTTRGGVYPFFIGGKANLTNHLNASWAELPLADLTGGAFTYLQWSDNATLIGSLRDWRLTGGNYASVTIQSTDIEKLFFKLLSGDGALSPQVRFLGDVSSPPGWLTLPAVDLKGANGNGYYQATSSGAYLGGLNNWSRIDALKGSAALNFTTFPEKIAVQIAP